MPDISAIKRLIGSNPIISAAVGTGDLKVVYRRKPVLDPEWLYVTWTVEFAILDAEVVPLLEAAIERLGGEITKRTPARIVTTFSLLLSSEEKRQLKEQQDQAAVEEKEQAAAGVIAELQQQIQDLRAAFTAQIQELREEAQLQSLVRRKPKEGPRGPAGPAGPAGRDLDATDVSIHDLADVSSMEPDNGQVLMWVELAQEYQPRRIPMSGSSISGGGGKGGGVQPENPGPGGPGDDTNNGWLLKWWYETEQGHFMPRTAGQNIGSAEVPVKEIYVSGGSILMDGHVVDLQERTEGSQAGEVRLAYDGRILAYETYTDGEPVEPFPDAPRDGYHYVRKDGTWVRLEDLLAEWGVIGDTVDGGLWSEIDCSLVSVSLDGGDFNTGETSMGIHIGPIGGGDFDAGTPDGLGDVAVDGGTLD